MIGRTFILDQGDAYDHPNTYRVFVEDEFRFAFDPNDFRSLSDVLDAIVGHIASLRADGIMEWDLSVWQRCRLVAAILSGRDGMPIVRVFVDEPRRLG